MANVLAWDGIRRDIANEFVAGARFAEVRPRAKLSGSFVQGCRKDICATGKGKRQLIQVKKEEIKGIESIQFEAAPQLAWRRGEEVVGMAHAL